MTYTDRRMETGQTSTQASRNDGADEQTFERKQRGRRAERLVD